MLGAARRNEAISTAERRGENCEGADRADHDAMTAGEAAQAQFDPECLAHSRSHGIAAHALIDFLRVTMPLATLQSV
jgi:hypothetical protein